MCVILDVFICTICMQVLKRQEDIRSLGPGKIGSAELHDWALQTEFRSSAWALSTLNFWAISAVPSTENLKRLFGNVLKIVPLEVNITVQKDFHIKEERKVRKLEETFKNDTAF